MNNNKEHTSSSDLESDSSTDSKNRHVSSFSF